MNNKDFIPYQESLELKKLGFDEPCFGYYYTLNGKTWQFAEKEQYYRLDDEVNIGGKFSLLAPLKQQVFRWFREKHNLIGGIEYIGGLKPKTTWWDIYVVGHYNIDSKKMEMKYQPYEEAELACLKKLIKIAKEKNNEQQ